MQLIGGLAKARLRGAAEEDADVVPGGLPDAVLMAGLLHFRSTLVRNIGHYIRPKLSKVSIAIASATACTGNHHEYDICPDKCAGRNRT